MNGRVLTLLVVVLLAIGGGFYWYSHRAAPAPAPAAAAPPAPEVGIITASPQIVPLTFVYAARVAGYRDVEIRAQVNGVLLTRDFDEGALVKQGQQLFQIDPKPYQAALDRANAQLAQAQASLRQGEDTVRRNEELFRRQVVADKQRDDAVAARDQAQASVQLAQSEVDVAKLNLGYTRVTSPVTGSTRLLSPPVGSLVQSQQTLLTTVTVLDPAYVNFSFTDTEFQAFRALNARLATPITERDLRIELRYSDGTVYPEQGTLDASANLVNAQTGTIQARAIFANPKGALLPGQFVRVAVRGISLPNAIAIPKQAVSQGAQGPSVYVLGDANTATSRPIRLGQDLGDRWVVEDGVKANDRVVVDGIMRIRPGATVRPVPFVPPDVTAKKTGTDAR